MTETTKEILDKYQVRRSGKQKQAFRDYLKNVCKANNYEYKEEKGSFKSKNIVIGDVENAKVIYTAHYDTQTILPFPYFHMPKKPFLTILLQMLMSLIYIFAVFATVALSRIVLDSFGISGIVFKIVEEVIVIMFLLFPFVGITNKHTSNDNTSGVTTLIDLMLSLSEEDRKDVAFIFFDMEELGLVGSRSFASKHKNIKNNKLIINFDCVSNGKKFLFVVPKKAKKYSEVIEKAFNPTDSYDIEIASRGCYFPSDQAAFKCGIGVVSLNKKGKIEYLSNIHSPKDRIYDEKNIEFLVDGAKKLAQELKNTNE